MRSLQRFVYGWYDINCAGAIGGFEQIMGTSQASTPPKHHMPQALPKVFPRRRILKVRPNDRPLRFKLETPESSDMLYEGFTISTLGSVWPPQ